MPSLTNNKCILAIGPNIEKTLCKRYKNTRMNLRLFKFRLRAWL